MRRRISYVTFTTIPILVLGLLFIGLLSATTYAKNVESDGATIEPVPWKEQETSVGTSMSAGTTDASGIESDDFNACSLDTSLWTLVDQKGDVTLTMSGTHASILVPGGSKHDLWDGDKSAPRIMQSANDADFEVEVKFDSGLGEKFQIQGIVVEEQRDEDFLRFDFHSDGLKTKMFAAKFVGGTAVESKNQVITDTNVAPLYMRVVRSGNVYTQSYSFDGSSWTSLHSLTHTLAVSATGPFVGNVEPTSGGTPPTHTAVIDYFFNTASPITPEDGDENTVADNVIGDGTINKDPDKTSYECGEEITLTAAPDPGWSFAGWSGALSGSTNPATMTVTGDHVVTATFTQNEYTLDVGTVGNGSVAKDPNQPTYHLGDVVTLTATPDPGWSFAGWSGDLSGTSNPDTVTITGDTVVTATFTQDAYTLDVNVVGDGSVASDPDQADYVYGDVVTLTATPATGWFFAGWSGDLSGTGNPATVTITGDTVVTATFTEETYTLDVNIIGDGDVSKVPDQAGYSSGDVVTLTATPDPGWSFAGWSGDLSGATNPDAVTITGDTVVTATFTQDAYTLDVNVVGDGSVASDPDQADYVYGDVVTLTATPATGWFFAGWSGDLSGTGNPATVTITGDTVVTATFDQHRVYLPLIGSQTQQSSSSILTDVSAIVRSRPEPNIGLRSSLNLLLQKH